MMNAKFPCVRSAIAIALMASLPVHAADSFDSVTSRLTLESVSVGGQIHRAVSVTVNAHSLVSVGSGAPMANTFDPSTNLLTMGAVVFQGTTYNNVQVRIDSHALLGVAPASSYTGEHAVAYNLINAERNTCGFGLLTQNASLDAAAGSHVAYTPQSAITGEDLHAEVPGRAGFTGVTPLDRATAKGYAGTVSEVMALGTGTTAVRLLLSAPYHLLGLMDGYRDIGIGMVPSSIPDFPYFVANPGVQSGVRRQTLASSEVATYPCNGTTGVNFQLRGEIPNPVPGRDLSANPIGTPILVKVRNGNVLQITSATMVNVATDVPVALRAPVGAYNDPNAGNGYRYFDVNEAYVAPDAPLSKGTQYQATINGTNNGVAFTRSFTFTTGNGVN